jgi:catechol 2,3-dioxygenase-like lactoylglutathione lyase family enzyme
VRFEERVMSASAGIHHVTAICRDPANNVSFYTGNLGLRLVKRTVNFDHPSTWHLYYGDEVGRPGTALTFFAGGEQQPSGRNGNGMATETAFIIPESSLGYWAQRLIERDIAHEAPEKRFGERVLSFRDADGMRLALVAVKGADEIPGWSNGDVPAEHALRGFRGVTLMVGAGEPTAEVLTGAFGFQAQAQEGHVVRYRSGSDRLATVIDVRTAEGFLAGARAPAPCTMSRFARPPMRRRLTWSRPSGRTGCTRPTRSIVAISAPSIFENRAVSCWRLPPTSPASPSTRRRERWVRRSSSRRGWRRAAPRSLRRCPH